MNIFLSEKYVVLLKTCDCVALFFEKRGGRDGVFTRPAPRLPRTIAA